MLDYNELLKFLEIKPMANITQSKQLTLSKCITYIILASQLFIVLPELVDICISLSMKIDIISNKKRFFDGLFCQVNEIRIIALFGHLHFIHALRKFVFLKLATIKLLVIYISLLIIKLKYQHTTLKTPTTDTKKISSTSLVSYLSQITLITLMGETCSSILPFV